MSQTILVYVSPKAYFESRIWVQELIYEVIPGSMSRKRKSGTGKGGKSVKDVC